MNVGFREEDCVSYLSFREAQRLRPTPTVQAGDVRPVVDVERLVRRYWWQTKPEGDKTCSCLPLVYQPLSPWIEYLLL